MGRVSLGRLQQVALREAWANEARDFTPWLAQQENLSLLGEAIGAELEPHEEESSVGPFRADILCRDLGSDSWVLIENQLERTDHKHLGQVLTYTDGLDAVTVVWVAEKFTEEHRAALDWLNQHTTEDIAFFGLEVELWKIGSSEMAPKFNVVSKPNSWTKEMTARTSNSANHELCWNFWAGVLDELKPYNILEPSNKPRRRKDIRFDVGWHTFFLKAFISTAEKKQGVWVECRGRNGFENFTVLEQNIKEIEAAFGDSLVRRPMPDKDRGRLVHYLTKNNVENREDWPRQQKEVAAKVAALYSAVKPFVEELDVGEVDDEEK